MSVRVDRDLDREVPVLLGLGQDAEVGGRRGRRAAAAVSTSPLGGVPSVTDLCTTGPVTNAPRLLMEDSSTRERHRRARRVAVQRARSARSPSAWACSFTAVITCGHLEGPRRR